MTSGAPRLWPGETIAICASGPSLTADVCSVLRGRVPTIAINDAVQLAPWADVLYSSDRGWWPRRSGMPSFAGLKFGIGSGINKKNPFANLPDVRVLRNTGYEGLEIDPSGLRNGRHSGFAAINLAVHLGAAKILLLGYDLRRVGPATHFKGAQKPCWETSDSAYVGYARMYATLREPLQAAGVTVLNCTPESAITAFPFASLADVLPAQVAA